MLLKRIASISALTLLLTTGAAYAKTPGISSTASKISENFLLDDDANNSPDVTPTENETTASISDRNAMTWRSSSTTVVLNGKTYVLFASDNSTNPYQGDTSINEYRSLLCINKTGAPAPAGLPPSSETPGGATKASWSGGTALVIPNVQGKQLTSVAVADKMCDQVGQTTRGTSGYRMAEFHDGTGPNPGWSFWAEAYGEINGFAPSARYWVRINDQPANPWG